MARVDERSGSSSIKRPLEKVRRTIILFHQDEQGLKSVEMLLLIFIAAIILIAFLKIFFPEVSQRVKGKVMELLGMQAG